MAQRSDAFDLTDGQIKAPFNSREELGVWLANELDSALEVRGHVENEIKYAWQLYQQDRTRGRNAPWPDAADLTSPYASEYTDAVQARLMQTIFADTVWTVEGHGDAASRAAFVEEFHQRAQEEERLQSYLDDWTLRALVEGVGTLEISEDYELRRTAKRMRVQVAQDPLTGGALFEEDGKSPKLLKDAQGEYVEVGPDDPVPSAEVDVDAWEPVRQGPAYDVVPYLDFLCLPGHARHRGQIWGYAKRFWRRVPELTDRANRGIYDRQTVQDLGESNDRDVMDDEAPQANVVIASQYGPTAQKELWEVQFTLDLDGKGERWYRATLHKDSKRLLRLKRDDRTTRYLRYIPFPKPGSVDRGYSLITNKLMTVIEEDTAVRNMRADRAALAVSAPIKRLQGALWDPYEEPFGPRSVIDVNQMEEVQPMPLADVPPSINVWFQMIRADADRLIGQNDTSLGTSGRGDQTLGEIRLRAGYAEVRMDLLVKRCKEPMEELGQARHTIWKRTLAGRTAGLPVPTTMVMGLEARGIDMSMLAGDQSVTADMLEGQFWFKPRGSVETADKNVRRALLNQLLPVLMKLSQANPMFAAMFQTPPAVRAIAEEIIRAYQWEDRQAFLGPEANDAMQSQSQMSSPAMQMLLAMASAGAPGLPPGLPPGGPGGPLVGPQMPGPPSPGQVPTGTPEPNPMGGIPVQ